jgi:spermidine/putrescine transport system permease protein
MARARSPRPFPGVRPIGRPFWLMLPGVAWLLVFGLAPVAFMVAVSFWRSSIFGTTPDFVFDSYARIVEEPLYLDLIVKTLRMAALTTLLSLIFSYPLAWFLATRHGAWKAICLVAVFVPFWISYVVRTFVWLPILGRNGLINQALLSLGIVDAPVSWLLYNEGAVYLGLVYVYTLFMTLPIYLALGRIDPKLLEASADLGARPWQTFRHVVLPLSWPGVLSGCIMVFLLAVSAYVTPRLLGGTSGIMLGNMIASQFLSNNNWAMGAALSVTLVAIVGGLLLITGRWIGVAEVFTGGKK